MPPLAVDQLIRSADLSTAMVGSLGCRFMLDANITTAMSVVAHTLGAHRLGAPDHRHTREDEYSIVTSGTITVLLGEQTVEASAGDVVVKPRGQWHTFWNATDEEATLLEIIVPGGFEGYFAEIDALLRASAEAPLAAIGAVAARYGLEIRPESIPELCATHGLTL
ncbi:hypothetical protein GCM10028798_13580 [Humibacter antri]